MKKLFAVRDAKSGSWGPISIQEHSANAIRSFEQAVMDTGTQLHKWPEDFAMFEIGTYDDQKGLVTALDQPHLIANAMDVKTRHQSPSLSAVI